MFVSRQSSHSVVHAVLIYFERAAKYEMFRSDEKSMTDSSKLNSVVIFELTNELFAVYRTAVKAKIGRMAYPVFTVDSIKSP